MAEFDAQPSVDLTLNAGDSTPLGGYPHETPNSPGFCDAHEAIQANGVGSSGGFIPHFKMRGLASPGPGFVVWVTSISADFAGAQAPAAVQGGTVVVADDW